MTDHTFLGLKPYSEDDADRFKGRTEESQELFKLIVRNDYTVCYAESGEGKTSLLNAGVFPLLRENMYFPIEITFTENDFQTTPDRFDRIIDRCISDSIAAYNEKNQDISIEYRLCTTDFSGMETQSQLQQELSQHSWWKLRNYKPQAMGLTFTPVFVFDQFEEVFSLPGSTVWTHTFFKWLEEVSADTCPDHLISTIRSMIGADAAFPAIKEDKDFKAVFSLRKEFMGELDYWAMQQCFIPALKDNRYCLKPLTYLGAQKVMQQQSRFEAAKVEQVLHHFVSLYSREPHRTISKNLPAIPALLLSVVGDSWEKDLHSFDTADIAQSLNQILERFYNETLSAVVTELTQADHNTPPATLRHDIDTALFALVDANSKRVRTKTTSSVLTAIHFDQKYQKALSDHRIIKVSKIEGEDYVEIVHDALCPIVNKKKEERLAAEAKEKMRAQTRKMRMWLAGAAAIILVAVGVIGYILLLYGQIKEQNIQIKNQGSTIASQEAQLRHERDSIQQTNSRLEQVLQSLQLANHEKDSANNQLILSYQKLSENERQLLRANEGFQTNLSRVLAEQANRLTDNHDSYLARLIALQALPPYRPYTIEAEIALRNACQHNEGILRGHTYSVNSASFSPNGKYIVSASRDNTIRIWDAKTGKQVGEPLKGHTSYVKSASFSPDGNSIVSASWDNTIRIWDAKTGKQVGEPLEGHTYSVNSASFSPDGNSIVSASSDNTVRIWDAKTGKQVGEPLKGHTHYVYSASFSPDGNSIVSASADNTVRIWDAKTGKQVGEPLKGHTSSVYSASFSPDGNSIVSASWDNTIRIWDAKTGKQVGEPLKGHTDDVNSASFSPDGNSIVSASDDNTVRIWDAKTGKQVGEPLKGHTDNVYSASFSPDGNSIVSASWDNTIRIWDTKTGKQVGKPLEGHTDFVRSASFSPDGNSIVSASGDNTIRIWHAKTGKQVGEPLKGHTGIVNSASFSLDGNSIVSASDDNTIRIWDAKTGKQVGEPLEGHTGWVYSASFSPDGNSIVSASADKTIRIWDAKTGKQVGEPLEGHTGWVYSASFSPDGNSIVSASSDNTIRIWDAKTGMQVGKPLEGHTGIVNSASFSPDGNSIVSASWDNTVRIWDVKTGKQVGEPLKGHTSPVYSVSFSPDGKHIVSASKDHTIRIWDIPTLDQLIQETTERFKDRQLTPEERRQYYLE